MESGCAGADYEQHGRQRRRVEEPAIWRDARHSPRIERTRLQADSPQLSDE